MLITRDSQDEIVQAWSFATGQELHRVPYAKWPSASAVDPAGEWMASAGNDWLYGKNLLELTRIEPNDLVAYGCSGVSRNLSETEWQKYFRRSPYRITYPQLEESDRE